MRHDLLLISSLGWLEFTTRNLDQYTYTRSFDPHLKGNLLVRLGVHLMPQVLQSVEAVAVELGARSGGQQRPGIRGW